MLRLKRKPGEAVWIGDSVRLVVLSVEGERVEIGIDAPPHVPIMREELTKLAKSKEPKS
jgi:carbon storage regulator